jgi:UDPglucose 6-dehydrogenase
MKYLRGAVGYGGPCFPRDNAAFAALARSVGARADLAEATESINRHQIDRVSRAIVGRVRHGDPIAILGLSYKPDTAVVEQSQGVMLVERLLEMKHRVIAYDPKATAAAQASLLYPFETAASAEAAVRAASLVVVMTPWNEFRSLPAKAFARPAHRIPVVDCWRVLPAEVGEVADLIYLGVSALPPTSVLATRRHV